MSKGLSILGSLAVLFLMSACSKNHPVQNGDLVRDDRVDWRQRDGEQLGSERETAERNTQRQFDQQFDPDGGGHGGTRKEYDNGTGGDSADEDDDDNSRFDSPSYDFGSKSSNSMNQWLALLGIGAIFQGGNILSGLGDIGKGLFGGSEPAAASPTGQPAAEVATNEAGSGSGAQLIEQTMNGGSQNPVEAVANSQPPVQPPTSADARQVQIPSQMTGVLPSTPASATGVGSLPTTQPVAALPPEVECATQGMIVSEPSSFRALFDVIHKQHFERLDAQGGN